MIKRIADEQARIESYKHKVSSEDFFNDRKYKGDHEWLTLSYLTAILKAAHLQAPEYAEKIEGDSQPDFKTYLTTSTPYKKIEITEVLPPGYRRGLHYRQIAKSSARFYLIHGRHARNARPWSSFKDVLDSKLRKPYSKGTWLLIYHDMGYSSFQDGLLWHDRILRELQTWTFDSETTCDITRSQYESIYAIDSSGKAAVRLHPHWDVIKEFSENQDPLFDPFPT